jgi:hypothetical protein
MLKWIVRKCGDKMWAGFIWLRYRPESSCYEHDNRPSGSIKGRKFLDQFIIDSAP